MTGGVSLCVWMGGTAYELDRLRRKDGIYGALLEAVDAEPVVDIIGGTSAGGLNGTLLAAAIAWGSNLSGLPGVWYKLADFGSLLQPLSARKPLSLLQGDDFFLPHIQGRSGRSPDEGYDDAGWWLTPRPAPDRDHDDPRTLGPDVPRQ